MIEPQTPQARRAGQSPEYRKDPVVERWVIIAPERAHRPMAAEAPPAMRGGYCPFCEGHEVDTPGELLACRAPGTAPDQPGWRARVVPNMFPAVRPQGSLETRTSGLFQAMDGYGRHEVIIECPFHEIWMGELADGHVADVLSLYRQRLLALRSDPRTALGLIFKNVGAAAGASIEHSHSQLIALPMVPGFLQEEIDGAERYHARHQRCVYCLILAQELASRSRIVLETEHFVGLCPYASRLPFEAWVLPKQHLAHFERHDEAHLLEQARVLRALLRKLEAALGRPAYNYVLHTAPLQAPASAAYHWHWQILPRLTRVAGFELATGVFINPVPPEQAARLLRDTRS